MEDPELAADHMASIVQDRCASLRAELEKLEAIVAGFKPGMLTSRPIRLSDSTALRK